MATPNQPLTLRQLDAILALGLSPDIPLHSNGQTTMDGHVKLTLRPEQVSPGLRAYMQRKANMANYRKNTHDRIKHAIQCAVFDKEIHPQVAECLVEELDRLIAVDERVRREQLLPTHPEQASRQTAAERLASEGLM